MPPDVLPAGLSALALGGLAAAFFLVALLYASAGFGGGSSYLAILSAAGLPVGGIRPVALACNLIVSGGGALGFAKARKVPWRTVLPLVAASIPAAFAGGRVTLPRETYLLLLGVTLACAGLAMLLRRAVSEGPVAASRPVAAALLVGAGIGFLSGVVGIGGGIFLSPVLFLSRRAPAREIAATTSVFIFVNSLAGLAGYLSRGQPIDFALLPVLGAAVLAGGTIGSRLSLKRLSPKQLRAIAGALVLAAGLRLLWLTA